MAGWVFLFPGQGSQYVGMGKDFYENYREVQDIFEQAEDVLHMQVRRLCFEGPEDVLTLTKNVQPAITVVNIACHTVMRLHDVHPVATAGHSLGEYSALYAAGVLSLEETLKLVQFRGLFMHQAAQREPGAMAAIMNLEREKLDHVCRVCNVEIANINCPGQIIVTGPISAVEHAIELSLREGAKKSIKLNVSGPWHSRYMESAAKDFEFHVRRSNFSNPKIPIVTNVDARPLETADQVATRLIRQLCNPVLWKESMEWLISKGYQQFVEVGPKKVLRGLMRRIDRKINVTNVEDTASLTSFLQRIK